MLRFDAQIGSVAGGEPSPQVDDGEEERILRSGLFFQSKLKRGTIGIWSVSKISPEICMLGTACSRPEGRTVCCLFQWFEPDIAPFQRYTFRARSTGRFPTVREEMAHFLFSLDVDGLFTDNPDQFPRQPPRPEAR